MKRLRKIGVRPDAQAPAFQDKNEPMRFCVVATLIGFGIACATRTDRQAHLLETEVVTFPQGALVQYEGRSLGRAPVKIVLPQNEEGRLTGRAEVRAIPNTEQSTLYPQRRIFDPSNRVDRVPNRIMIDLTLQGTNPPIVAQVTGTNANVIAQNSVRKQKPVERSKPTRAIGLDRWNPGEH